MDLQGSIFDLMAEEDFSYADGLNLDQELSYVVSMEFPFC